MYWYFSVSFSLLAREWDDKRIVLAPQFGHALWLSLKEGLQRRNTEEEEAYVQLIV